jgi:predicted O-linked N-acetylglucosamine transferase (SPINDLY family)
LEAFVSQLDRSQIELIGYPSTALEDDLTARIKPHFARWQPLVGLNDEQAAAQIHADAPHILIDLAGHTAHNRLPVFAYKPAPVQASWLGYFATTGVAEIDYIIGDPYVTPDSEASHFVERLWRLPESYFCMAVPQYSIELTEPPILRNGYPTFGCFNNLAKVNDRVIALWARLLQRMPEARLFLKTKQLADATVRERLLERFTAHQIGPERLLLEGPGPRAELLAAYNRIDIALDPFPYPGGTTSAEALWMGVPVITKRGDRFLSHVGETIAHNCGHPEWIAEDEEQYILKAIQLASNPNTLQNLKLHLRQQLPQQPLFNSTTFAQHFQKAMQRMWSLSTRHKWPVKTAEAPY